MRFKLFDKLNMTNKVTLSLSKGALENESWFDKLTMTNNFFHFSLFTSHFPHLFFNGVGGGGGKSLRVFKSFLISSMARFSCKSIPLNSR